MNESKIQSILLRYYYEAGKKIACTNYSGCGLDECDVIMVSSSGIVYEYEIKCTRSDFKADFKKTHKHSKLRGDLKERIQEYQSKGWFLIPNHFYYVCEDSLIREDEIPLYAGLIYIVNNEPQIIKKAPKLHSTKATQRLLDSILNSLTIRLVYGCAYLKGKYRQELEIINTDNGISSR